LVVQVTIISYETPLKYCECEKITELSLFGENWEFQTRERKL